MMEPGPLRVLSLDGGGIRGLSSLRILEEIMHRIQEELQLEEIPRPCEFFDLIGGTSTGGIIALMLGRLGMRVDECIQAYEEVAEQAFSARPFYVPGLSSSKYSSTSLEKAFDHVVRQYCDDAICKKQRNKGKAVVDNCPHSGMQLRNAACTKTAVLTITKDDVNASPHLLTTYGTSSAYGMCTITEAARATSAAPTYFKPIRLGRDGVEYVDAGLGYNNPCAVLVNEAHDQFPGRQPLRILSIGTGLYKVAPIGNGIGSDIKSLRRMATNTQKVEVELKDKYRGTQQYYRFSVDRGLDSVGLADYGMKSTIITHTENYLRENRGKIKEFVQAFIASVDRTRSPSPHLERRLQSPNITPTENQDPAMPPSRPKKIIHSLPLQNRDFVGRESHLKQLEDILFVDDRQSTSLVGLGGIGKTQIALELAHRVKKSRQDYSVIWLPAISLAAFEAACAKLGKECGITSASQDDAKETLRTYLDSAEAGKWFVVVDNADEAATLFDSEGKSGIWNFLPKTENGRILVTTRLVSVAMEATGPKPLLLDELDLGEAKRLLSKVLLNEKQLEDERMVASFVEKLAYFPLALCQAAAYMNQNSITMARYLQLCTDTDGSLVDLLGSALSSGVHFSDSQRAVATTWIISFEQIVAADTRAADLLKFIAWIEPKAIPFTILPGSEEERQMTEAIGVICNYGFLRPSEDGQLYDMHSLVHLALSEWHRRNDETGDGGQQVSGKWVAEHMVYIMVRQILDGRIWDSRQCLPHVLQVLELTGTSTDDWHAALEGAVGLACSWTGRYAEALEHWERCAELRRANLAEDDGRLLWTLDRLALGYLSINDCEKGLALCKEVAAVQERTKPEHDWGRLHTQVILAQAYGLNGRTQESIALLEQIHSIHQTHHPRNHRNGMTIAINMAQKYREDAQYAKALHFSELAMGLAHKQRLQAHDPVMIQIQTHLASVYRMSGHPVRAIEILQQLLKTVESSAKYPGHDDSVLDAQMELACSFRKNNQLQESVALMEHVARVAAQSLPANDLKRLAYECELVTAYIDCNRLEGAIEHLQRIHNALKGIPLKTSELRRQVQKHLALAYLQVNGRTKEALGILEELKTAESAIYREDHPCLTTTRELIRYARQIIEEEENPRASISRDSDSWSTVSTFSTTAEQLLNQEETTIIT
ncbi:hypothetical protein S40293_08680 [Stachybotrys chartarum IBT 40293]|nr:hypothetical protein S40293_08680 [Stachybotrys chartarum IBT 40293]